MPPYLKNISKEEMIDWVNKFEKSMIEKMIPWLSEIESLFENASDSDEPIVAT